MCSAQTALADHRRKSARSVRVRPGQRRDSRILLRGICSAMTYARVKSTLRAGAVAGASSADRRETPGLVQEESDFSRSAIIKALAISAKRSREPVGHRFRVGAFTKLNRLIRIGLGDLPFEPNGRVDHVSHRVSRGLADEIYAESCRKLGQRVPRAFQHVPLRDGQVTIEGRQYRQLPRRPADPPIHQRLVLFDHITIIPRAAAEVESSQWVLRAPSTAKGSDRSALGNSSRGRHCLIVTDYLLGTSIILRGSCASGYFSPSRLASGAWRGGPKKSCRRGHSNRGGSATVLVYRPTNSLAGSLPARVTTNISSD